MCMRRRRLVRRNTGCTVWWRRIWRDANWGAVRVHDRMGRSTGEWRRHSLAISFELVPQQVYIPAHLLVALLEGNNEVDGCRTGACKHRWATHASVRCAPLLSISHLLAFIPLSAGS